MQDTGKSKARRQVKRQRAIKSRRKKKNGAVEIAYWQGVYINEHSTRKHRGEPDQCYYICYRYEGKLKWERIGWASEGYTPAAAEAVRGERIRTKRHGEELPQQKKRPPLFSDVAKKYLEWAAYNKTQNGLHDKSRYENHIKNRLMSKRLDEITPLDIERMKAGLTNKGLSPQTVKHCLALTRAMFNKAIAWGLWTGGNPVQKVKLPSVKNERERFLSYEEAELLLARLKDVSLLVHDMALISLHCGLRFGEIANLRGIDIDIKNCTIHVADPKNEQPRKAYTTRMVDEMLKNRLPSDPEGYVFVDRKSKGRINGISHTFPRIVKELGFNDGITDRRQRVTFHTLRHTHASWLALSGESLLVIREALGHRDLKMTSRYAHLGADSRKQAAHRLEDAFNKKKAGADAKRKK